MADDDDDIEELDEDDADGEDEDGEGSSKGGKKKLIIIIAAAVLLLVAGGAGAYFMGVLDPLLGGGDAAEEEYVEGEEGEGGGAVFFDLEELLVNLNTGGRKSQFLKIKVSLELERQTDVPKVEALMPRIVDNFQVYLRELRIDDLKGSAGMYRLREEMLMRVNAAVAPTRVSDVLFKEMLVQ